MKYKRIKTILFLIFSILILTLSFQENYFGAASKEFFDGFQRDSEALVIGRVVETKNKGYLSRGGFLGRYVHEKNYINYQYDTYKNNLNPESEFRSYISSAGLQGFFFSFTDSVLIFFGIESGEYRLYINKLIGSLSVAILVSVFIVFIKIQFGYFVSIITLVLTSLSQWIVVFSNNLYWMFFLILLPFILVIWFLQFNSKSQRNFNLLYFLVCFAILVKSLAGYEYISTIFLSMLPPVIFFAIKDGWKFLYFIKILFQVGFAGLIGFISAICIHIIQLSFLLGDPTKAFKIFWDIVGKRTHGNPSDFSDVYRASLESTVTDVLVTYWNSGVFNISNFFGIGGTVTSGQIIVFLIFITAIGLLLANFNKNLAKLKKTNFSITIALWFSILAPASWYVLAKGHSFIHVHINHVLWHVPFLLFGFVYIGFFIKMVIILSKTFKKGSSSSGVEFTRGAGRR